ncbi:MAG: class E sortase [Actinomycetota bacterium]
MGNTSKGRRPGWILRLIGKSLLTAAAIMGAYIVWLLWGTGIVHGQQQGQLRDDLEVRIDAAAAAEPEAEPPPRLPGEAYALMHIPDLDLNEVVVEGISTEALQKGPGHYPRSANPWDADGRVAIAGHRTTYGAPFWDLDKLDPGDQIQLETEKGVFEYVVSRSKIVAPTATEVTLPTSHPTLILTTCNPRFSAAERLIVFADLVTPTA